MQRISSFSEVSTQGAAAPRWLGPGWVQAGTKAPRPWAVGAAPAPLPGVPGLGCATEESCPVTHGIPRVTRALGRGQPACCCIRLPVPRWAGAGRGLVGLQPGGEGHGDLRPIPATLQPGAPMAATTSTCAASTSPHMGGTV